MLGVLVPVTGGVTGYALVVEVDETAGRADAAKGDCVEKIGLRAALEAGFELVVGEDHCLGGDEKGQKGNY